MNKFISNILKKRGYYIYKEGVTDKNAVLYSKILKHFNIKYVLDIGANTGQYAASLRKLGYNGVMYSFEPLSSAFSELKINARNDEKWHVFNYALGEIQGNKNINVSANSVSSSLNNIKEEHIKNEPLSVFINKEEIKIETLNNVIKTRQEIDLSQTFVKIDTQGYEKNVLAGGDAIFGKVPVIQLEISLVSLYEDTLSIEEMLMYMRDKGYFLYNLFPAFQNFNKGQMLQGDFIFCNKNIVN